MQAYQQLLLETGFKDVTPKATKERTDQVRDFKKGQHTIVLDGINLHVLKNNTGILHFPLTDNAFCLAAAYILLPSSNRSRYQLNDVRTYLEKLPNKRNDKLQEKMMILMFELGNIRQNALK